MARANGANGKPKKKRVRRAGADPGGRPRKYPLVRTAFGDWLKLCGMSPREVGDALGIATSSVYNLKNGNFLPGRALAVRIAELTENQVPVQSW